MFLLPGDELWSFLVLGDRRTGVLAGEVWADLAGVEVDDGGGMFGVGDEDLALVATSEVLSFSLDTEELNPESSTAGTAGPGLAAGWLPGPALEEPPA